MDKQINHINEQRAAAAFSKQSAVFDSIYETDTIIKYKRDRVRRHVLAYLPPEANILELNAGTGDDAVFFGMLGYRVHATDISTGMQAKLEQKVAACGLTALISNELCSFTCLGALQKKGPYDHIFSNFAGLNCTGELEKVLAAFDKLLKPGGMVTLVVMPKFCLWETALIFKGKFKTALRRFFSRNGRIANVEGLKFSCWYYAPKRIRRILKHRFDHIKTEGLCTCVPPSYITHFAEKHPRLFSFLCKKEDRLKSTFPWKYIGDYYIITLKKR